MSGSEMTNVGGSSGGVDGGGMQNPPTQPPQAVTQNIPAVVGSEGIAGNGSGRGRGRGRGRGNGSSGRGRRGRPRRYGPETTMAVPLSFAPPAVTPPPQQRQRIQYRQLPPYHLSQQQQQQQIQQEQPPMPTLQPQQNPPQLQQQPPQPPIQEQPPLQEVQQQPPLQEEEEQQLPPQPQQEGQFQPPPPLQPQQEGQHQPPTPQPQQEDQQQLQPQRQQQQQQGGGSQRKVRRRPRGGRRVRQGMHGNSAIFGLVGQTIFVNTGEDVSSKIMALTQSGVSVIFILSAIGYISNATIRPVLPGDSSTYEGRFEILSLSGSFRLSDGSGPRSWTGGFTVSLIDPDGRILGGGVAGLLTAASPIQVAVAFSVGDGRNVIEPVVSPARPLAVAGPAGPRSPPSRGTLRESPGVAGSSFNRTAEAADSTPDPLTISGSP